MFLYKLNVDTCLWLAAIIISSVLCWIYVSKLKKDNNLSQKRHWVEQLPSFVSTLGVLGTFYGITCGLWVFDVKDLDKSIPVLLGGLKTAFITSLAGMVGSLIVSRKVNKSFDKEYNGVSDMNTATEKICNAMLKVSNTLKETNAITNAKVEKQIEEQSVFYQNMAKAVNTVIMYLSNQENSIAEIKEKTDNMLQCFGNVEENIIQQTSQLKEVVNNVVTSITEVSSNIGEGIDLIGGIATTEEEISEEIKKFSELLRGEVDEIELKMKETNELLAQKFDEFSDLLKKSNTEALVGVMKKVTEEFQKHMNSLISKLVQENFAKLNQSVERLNTWQQENKQMIASLTSQYQTMASNFESNSKVLTTVGNDTKSLVSEGGRLHQLVNSLNQVIVEDKKFVEITNGLLSATASTQNSMQQFEESTKMLNEWVRKQRNFVEGVQQLIEKLEDVNKIKDYNEQFWKGTKKSLEEGVGFISKGSETLQTQLVDLDKQFYARLSTTLAELDTCIQALIKGKKG